MLNTQDVRVRNARVETLRVGAYILANVRSQIHVLSLRVGPRVRTFRVASRVSGQLSLSPEEARLPLADLISEAVREELLDKRLRHDVRRSRRRRS
mgnify:CR=1 FL=1